MYITYVCTYSLYADEHQTVHIILCSSSLEHKTRAFHVKRIIAKRRRRRPTSQASQSDPTPQALCWQVRIQSLTRIRTEVRLARAHTHSHTSFTQPPQPRSATQSFLAMHFFSIPRAFQHSFTHILFFLFHKHSHISVLNIHTHTLNYIYLPIVYLYSRIYIMVYVCSMDWWLFRMGISRGAQNLFLFVKHTPRRTASRTAVTGV